MAQAPVASVIAPEQTPAIGRLPVHIVPAPISLPEVVPQTRSAVQGKPSRNQEPNLGILTPYIPPAEEEGGGAPVGRITSFPTLFMTQVMAQETASTAAAETPQLLLPFLAEAMQQALPKPAQRAGFAAYATASAQASHKPEHNEDVAA